MEADLNLARDLDVPYKRIRNRCIVSVCIGTGSLEVEICAFVALADGSLKMMSRPNRCAM